MSLDLNQVVPSVVRSVAIGAVLLPLSLSVSGTLNAAGTFLNSAAQTASSESSATVTKNGIKADLVESCTDYLLSKNDSKVEREAKDQIDEYFGGEVNYGEVCKWVYR